MNKPYVIYILIGGIPQEHKRYSIRRFAIKEFVKLQKQGKQALLTKEF